MPTATKASEQKGKKNPSQVPAAQQNKADSSLHGTFIPCMQTPCLFEIIVTVTWQCLAFLPVSSSLGLSL